MVEEERMMRGIGMILNELPSNNVTSTSTSYITTTQSGSITTLTKISTTQIPQPSGNWTTPLLIVAVLLVAMVLLAVVKRKTKK